MNRKEFLQSVGAALAVSSHAHAETPPPGRAKGPRAIAMWDFSWLERRWPGAGYEDWDRALDELADRGYDALRIDAYPHLVAQDPERSWLLKPKWDVQDWGAPTLVRVQPLPALYAFIGKCRDRGIKVGLSTWFREDEDKVAARILTAERMASLWITTLSGIQHAGLLDNVLYVDLANEWPIAAWTPIAFPEDSAWSDPQPLTFMKTAIGLVRERFRELPLLFSTDNERVEDFADHDVSFLDAIEHHVWMTGENDDEFYARVGYTYQRFSQEGYHNLQLRGADLYAERPAHWRKLLTDKIARLAAASDRAGKPVMTTECWAIVDYKDWPMLPWDWVKELCALGASTASETGRWAAIATSNFCGPQFRGMWDDVEWHRRLTSTIKRGPLATPLRTGRLWSRL